MQCVQVYVEGNLTAWKVSRQAFMSRGDDSTDGPG